MSQSPLVISAMDMENSPIQSPLYQPLKPLKPLSFKTSDFPFLKVPIHSTLTYMPVLELISCSSFLAVCDALFWACSTLSAPVKMGCPKSETECQPKPHQFKQSSIANPQVFFTHNTPVNTIPEHHTLFLLRQHHNADLHLFNIHSENKKPQTKEISIYNNPHLKTVHFNGGLFHQVNPTKSLLGQQ